MTSRIPHLRVAAVGVAAVLALTTAACAESTGGSGSRAGSAPSGSSSGSTSSSGGSVGTASSISDLASQLIAGTTHGTTVHLTLSSTTGSASSDAAANVSGDIRTQDGGKGDAFTFLIDVGSRSLSMVYVDGVGYVKLPPSEASDPSKPWAKISSTSSNPVVKALSAAFDQVGSETSLAQYAGLVKGATDFKALGPASVGGVTGQSYTFDVDPTQLPNAQQFGSVLSQIETIPTTLVVDDEGRPLQVKEKVTVEGQTVTTQVMFSRYGESVTFSAPPADQISAD